MRRLSLVKFNGIMPTPVTPFDKEGKVYEAGIERMVDFYHKSGITCLYCLGTYGGFAIMDKEERKRAAEFYITQCKKWGIKVIINISSSNEEEALELAIHSYNAGADAISTLVPYYYSYAYKDRNIVEYFKKIISAVDIPVYYYNNPRPTSYAITFDVFKKLLNVGLTGMKEGTGDLSIWLPVLDEISKGKQEFDLIPGQAKSMLMGLVYGAKSVMSGSAVFFPEINIETYNAFRDGDIEKAALLHRKLMKIAKIQGGKSMKFEACYAVLKMRGVDIGQPRSPWMSLMEEDVRKVKRDFEELGML